MNHDDDFEDDAPTQVGSLPPELLALREKLAQERDKPTDVRDVPDDLNQLRHAGKQPVTDNNHSPATIQSEQEEILETETTQETNSADLDNTNLTDVFLESTSTIADDDPFSAPDGSPFDDEPTPTSDPFTMPGMPGMPGMPEAQGTAEIENEGKNETEIRTALAGENAPITLIKKTTDFDQIKGEDNDPFAMPGMPRIPALDANIKDGANKLEKIADAFSESQTEADYISDTSTENESDVADAEENYLTANPPFADTPMPDGYNEGDSAELGLAFPDSDTGHVAWQGESASGVSGDWNVSDNDELDSAIFNLDKIMVRRNDANEDNEDGLWGDSNESTAPPNAEWDFTRQLDDDILKDVRQQQSASSSNKSSPPSQVSAELSKPSEPAAAAHKPIAAPTPPIAIAEQVYILCISGTDKGLRFNITEATNHVGRDAAGELVLTDPSVSRKHARIHFQAGKVLLEDCGSGNGCFVNRQKVSQQQLFGGDLVGFGNVVFELHGVPQSVVNHPNNSHPQLAQQQQQQQPLGTAATAATALSPSPATALKKTPRLANPSNSSTSSIKGDNRYFEKWRNHNILTGTLTALSLLLLVTTFLVFGSSNSTDNNIFTHFTNGRDALKEDHIEEAKTTFNIILQHHKNQPEALRYTAAIKLQEQYKQALTEAQLAFTKQAWAEMERALDTLPNEQWYPEAEVLRLQLYQAVTRIQEEAQRWIDMGYAKKGFRSLQQIQGLRWSNSARKRLWKRLQKVPELRSIFAQLAANNVTSVTGVTAKHTSPDNSPHIPEKPHNSSPSAQSSALNKARALYGTGSITQAIAALKALNEPQAATLAAAMEHFNDNYKRGIKLSFKGRLDQAIVALQAAYQKEVSITGGETSLSASVAGKLAELLVKQGDRYLENSKLSLGFTVFQQASTLIPKFPPAVAGFTSLSLVARTLLAQASNAEQRGNKTEAKQIYQQVTSITQEHTELHSIAKRGLLGLQ